jgi:rSAM/selenodomain-associated transferase 2
MKKVSVIIPVLNEVSTVKTLLASLQAARSSGHEIILADGGSTDGTSDIAREWVDQVLISPMGRAIQMNTGAQYASGDILWFLHADSELSEPVEQYLKEIGQAKAAWGRFDCILSGRQPVFRMIERLMNLRSRLTGIATGDQGIFVARNLFNGVGGFENVPLMEDVRLSKALGKSVRPYSSHMQLKTSSRRWEQKGIFRTILLMWYLRLAHFMGASPEYLVKKYYS